MELITGIQRRPLKIVIYGVPGVGKTTFAAAAPAPIFADLEHGSENFDVTRFPAINTFDSLIEAVGYLYSENHEFKTFVLDSMSVAERLANEKVCRDQNVNSIEDIGYGKGHVMASEEIQSLLRGLDALVAKGMNVIVVCHSIVTRFDDPAGDSYDTYDIVLSKRITPLVKQWADTVLFAEHDKSIVEKKDGFTKRKIAKSYGERIMFTEHRASHTAKNRFNLPEKMPLDWAAFSTAVDAFYTPATKGKKDAA